MGMKIINLSLFFAISCILGLSASADVNPPKTVIVRVEKSTGAVSISSTDQNVSESDAASVVNREFKAVAALDELDRDSSNSGWYYYYGEYAWAAPVYYYYGNAYYYNAYNFYQYAAYYYYFYRW